MMLTPEQRDELKAAAYGRGFVHDGLLRAVLAHVDAQQAIIAELEKYAARYRWLRNPNQRIDSVIDKRVGELSSGMWIWEYKAGEELDAAIDAAMKPTLTDDTSDYGSRIAVIGQNGATGEHYDEERNP